LPPSSDVLVVGAGAAGLAASIFIRQLAPSTSVALLDGAKRLGAKILVSGGGRCNVTNRHVTERDFHGGPPAVIRRVLRGLGVPETIAFFSSLGIRLHEEADGKLFPDSNRARDVLEALVTEAARVGVDLRTAHRVTTIATRAGEFDVDTSSGAWRARRVVLATGGCSLPKSGSDGAGYDLARRLGHTIVAAVPALVPLTLASDRNAIHARVAGVSVNAIVSVWAEGRIETRLRGALLWTHFGVSGPVVLDASRHWTRAAARGAHVGLTVDFAGGVRVDDVDARLAEAARSRPRAAIVTLVSAWLPPSLAAALVVSLTIDAEMTGAHLTRAVRQRLAQSLTAWPLAVSGTRGYNYAEVTAGGVDLREIDPGTMESRRCPGLYLVGEVLDADGRIGGFNFQWAWSSAHVCANGIARAQSSA
jgi:predicted Rossmann fold flavoprotein